MPADIIPVTGLNTGPVGRISQTDFPLVSPRQLNPTDTIPVGFGDVVVLNTNNTYSSVAQAIANGLTISSTTPLAIAMADVKTNPYYPLAGGQNMLAGQYAPGNIMDAITRGTINVYCVAGTPAGAGAAVYLRITLDIATTPAGVVGGLEAAADGANTVVIPNFVWKTGLLAPDKACQLTILNRMMS